MKLETLTKEHCELVRHWRNADLSAFRTAYMLTREMQEGFYYDVVCKRDSIHRYWAVVNEVDTSGIKKIAEWAGVENTFVGIGGLTDIQWENSNAEISFIINPKNRGEGIGRAAVELLLDRAFNHMNLNMVYGECYLCNPALKFWQKMAGNFDTPAKVQGGRYTYLPLRKYWNGKYYDSYYFCFEKEDYNE